jgi:hypothetical protein
MTAPCYFSLEEGELEKAARTLIKKLHILGTSRYNRSYWYFRGREDSESDPEEDKEAKQIRTLLKHWHAVGLIDIIKLRKRMDDEVWEEMSGS